MDLTASPTPAPGTERVQVLHARALARLRGLDDLVELGAAELEVLYRGARTPDLSSVRGDLRGRMLAVVAAAPVASLGHALARQSWFPWRGKSFQPPRDGAAHGDGVNRVFSDAIRWYRFETFVGRSRAGSFDAVQLDYDLEENPWFIRVIKDEIRALDVPGRDAPLYLGQAYMGRTLALYFGLE